MLSSMLPLPLGLVAWAGAALASPLEPRQDACNSATFTSSPNWPSYATIKVPPSIRSVGQGRTACYLEVSLKPSTSTFSFGLFLPTLADWRNNKSRFLAVGNGGYVPNITWSDFNYGASRGFATVATDTGHATFNQLDLSWAEDLDMRADFSYRAMDESVVVGKGLTQTYYGEAINKAYYAGCSTGGRQGLKQVQDHPDHFDGALIGAPIWDHKHELPWQGHIGTFQIDLPSSQRIQGWQVAMLIQLAWNTCDAVGTDPKDFVIREPESCSPNVDALLCAPGTAPDQATNPCLSSAQLALVKAMYSDYTIDGRFFFDHPYPGSEHDWIDFLLNDAAVAFSTQYQQHFLNRTGHPEIADWTRYVDAMGLISEEQNPGGINADNFSGMKAFHDRQGKMILYHGLADGLIPTRSSDRFFAETRRAVTGNEGGDVNDFLRYFHVPAMRHCGNADPDDATMNQPPWWFGAANQNPADATFVPDALYTRENNALVALMEWVEGTSPAGPSQILVSSFKGPGGSVSSQRPVCVFPLRPTYVSGAVNQPINWRCA